MLFNPVIPKILVWFSLLITNYFCLQIRQNNWILLQNKTISEINLSAFITCLKDNTLELQEVTS